MWLYAVASGSGVMTEEDATVILLLSDWHCEIVGLALVLVLVLVLELVQYICSSRHMIYFSVIFSLTAELDSNAIISSPSKDHPACERFTINSSKFSFVY